MDKATIQPMWRWTTTNQ